ncbi:MAG: hypothetical protein FWC28_03845 [Proteobacteria bacterium]|nr:hypothetical protein [Cystobacterineae bacterium]MCL2314369.1 hypothetical protein [Pseudomonadota bacterium]
MKKKIGEILIAHEVVSAEDVGEALALQAGGDPNRLGEILVARGRLGTDALARALAEQKALPYTELNLVSSSFTKKVPLKFQQRHGVVPFEEAAPGKFYIAVADPMATDAIEQAKHWLKASAIQLYVASAEEIERVLSAMGDNALVTGEVLAAEKEAPPKSPILSEEDLFGSLQFDEDEREKGGGPSPGKLGQRPPRTPLDETTQIVRRPSLTAGAEAGKEKVSAKRKSPKLSADEFSEREKTPTSSLGEVLPRLSPLGEHLRELLSGKRAADVADVVVGLADLLVKKAVLSREEVLEVFVSLPTEKW